MTFDAIMNHPDAKCSKCGTYEDDWEWMVPVQVIVSPGEEGHADITQFLCDQCFESVQQALVAAGFTTHHHGSTCLLEADHSMCGGYGVCNKNRHGGYPSIVGQDTLFEETWDQDMGNDEYDQWGN